VPTGAERRHDPVRVRRSRTELERKSHHQPVGRAIDGGRYQDGHHDESGATQGQPPEVVQSESGDGVVLATQVCVTDIFVLLVAAPTPVRLQGRFREARKLNPPVNPPVGADVDVRLTKTFAHSTPPRHGVTPLSPNVSFSHPQPLFLRVRRP
jgi:hypothetical protein